MTTAFLPTWHYWPGEFCDSESGVSPMSAARWPWTTLGNWDRLVLPHIILPLSPSASIPRVSAGDCKRTVPVQSSMVTMTSWESVLGEMHKSLSFKIQASGVGKMAQWLKGLGFDSQHPHGNSQPSVTPGSESHTF